jgi:hypothetical protein
MVDKENNMTAKIVQLCSDYNRVQLDTRDPRLYKKRESLLVKLDNHKTAIEQRVMALMLQLGELMTVRNVSVQVAELTYFNTWYNDRGGWT